MCTQICSNSYQPTVRLFPNYFLLRLAFNLKCSLLETNRVLYQNIRAYLFILKNFILFFNFTLLYWFCHISKWIYHRYTRVPHPEPSSLLPPHTIPLGHPSAPAPSIQYRALNLDWQLVSYMILYVSMPFSQIIPPSPSPTESKRLFYTSVSLLLSCIQGYCYHFSKFHIYALVYCIGVFLSGLLHSV